MTRSSPRSRVLIHSLKSRRSSWLTWRHCSSSTCPPRPNRARGSGYSIFAKTPGSLQKSCRRPTLNRRHSNLSLADWAWHYCRGRPWGCRMRVSIFDLFRRPWSANQPSLGAPTILRIRSGITFRSSRTCRFVNDAERIVIVTAFRRASRHALNRMEMRTLAASDVMIRNALRKAVFPGRSPVAGN